MHRAFFINFISDCYKFGITKQYVDCIKFHDFFLKFNYPQKSSENSMHASFFKPLNVFI